MNTLKNKDYRIRRTYKSRFALLKNAIALLCAALMVLGSIPFDFMAMADTTTPPVVISNITVTCQKTIADPIGSYVLHIDGSGLKNQDVKLNNTSSTFDLGSATDDNNVNYYLKGNLYDSNGLYKISDLLKNQFKVSIGGLSINVALSSTLPDVRSVSPQRVYGSNPLDISGTNLNVINPSDSSYDSSVYMLVAGNANCVPYFSGITSSSIHINDISKIVTLPGDHDIEVGKKASLSYVSTDGASHTAEVDQKVIYQNFFTYYQNLPNINVTAISPNKGLVNSHFYLKGTGMDSGMSVFLLKKNDGSDAYTLTNLSPQVTVTQDTYNHNNGLDVVVPSTLSPGEYFIALTNRVSSAQDPSSSVNSVYIVPDKKFTVVSEGNQMTIAQITPSTGTDSGLSNASVTGKYIATLNIDEIKNVVFDNVTASVNSAGRLQYTYTNSSMTVTKQIGITIGRPVNFSGVDTSTNIVGNQGSPDTIHFRIDPITDSSENKVEDVTVDTTTTIHYNDGSKPDSDYTESAQISNGFTFTPSLLAPKITSVQPPYGDKNSQIYLSISGSNFIVYKYTDQNGNQKTKYPQVKIGNIELDQNMVDDTGKVNNPITVLDKDNNIVDGSVNNMQGSTIIVRIPANIPDPLHPGSYIQKPLLKQSVKVVNPVLNDTADAYGLSDTLPDSFQFTVPQPIDIPTITSVDPTVVPTDGNIEVTVTGNNFRKDSILTIDGQVIKGAKIDDYGQTITFTAPPYHQIINTLLQVINPTGGIASHNFTYTKTHTNPKITAISPNIGRAGTLVTISGDGFFKTDTTVDTGDLTNIIGTTVLFDDKDLNIYNKVNGDIVLKDYVFGPVFNIANGNVTINKGYDSAIFQGADSNLIIYNTLDSKVMMQDGTGAKYTLRGGSNNTIEAVDGLGNIKYLTMPADGQLSFDGVTYSSKTVYTFDATTGAITGKNVRVMDDSTILLTVPASINGIALKEGLIDVTVKNPDTKTAVQPGGFYYSVNPKSNPKIAVSSTGLPMISPAIGSQDGGNTVKITGTDFQNGIRVFFGQSEADPKSVSLAQENGKYVVYAQVPKLPFDLKSKGMDSMWASVVVVNPDGGSDYVENGYKYVIPQSHPKIYQVTPSSDSAAGGTNVTIMGYDFRGQEPFTGNYDANAQMNLPIVTFGGKQAIIVDFMNVPAQINGKTINVDKIDCILPSYYQSGKVDVGVTNQDGGTAILTNGFEYKQSTPQITTITPPKASISGGTPLSIRGSGFIQTPYVQFGDISNAGYAPTDAGYGNIVQGKADVDLGNIHANYTIDPQTAVGTLTLSGSVNGYQYKNSYIISTVSPNYINIGTLALTANDGTTRYTGLGMPGYDNENVKIEIQNGRLLVTRGYAAKVTYVNDKLLTVIAPPMVQIGKYNVYVTNSDGGQATSTFEYTNPLNNPKIYDILKGGQEPVQTTSNNNPIRVVYVSAKGGNQLTIKGANFQDGIIVMVGNGQAKVNSNPVLDNTMTITLPQASADDVGKLLSVIAMNPDGGYGDSSQNTIPLYIEYNNSTNDPVINTITPAFGSIFGGTNVTISGKNFKAGANVYFGNAIATNVKVTDSNTITCTTPVNQAGSIDVTVENVDTGQNVLTGGFKYISSPYVRVATPQVADVNGGDVIIINGTGFMNNADVYFGPSIEAYDPKKTYTSATNIYKTNASGLLQYVLTDGIKATKVEYVDSQTLKVTVPAGTLNTVGLIVVNPDTGASDIYSSFKYGVKPPDTPVNVSASLIFNKYIRVSWNTVNNVDYYEVYRVINGQYYFEENTNVSSYIESSVDPNTQYQYVVKAIKTGIESEFSLPSNIVYTPYYVDNQGNKEGPVTMHSEITVSGSGDAVINIGDDNKFTSVDLTDAKYKNVKSIVINITAGIINSSSNAYVVNFNGGSITVPVSIFKVDELKNLSSDDLAHSTGRIKLNFKADNSILDNMPSSLQPISNIFNVDAEVQNNNKITALDALAGYYVINIPYDNSNIHKVKGASYTNTAYYYDYDAQSWKQVKSNDINGIKQINTNSTGTYAVLSTRN